MKLTLSYCDYLIILLVILSVGLLGFFVYVFLGESVGPNFFEALSEEFEKNPPTWERCEIDIPNIESKLIFLRKPSHPFLAEFERKICIEKPNELPQFLPLPMNTGGETQICVFLIQKDDKKHIRLKDHGYLNVVIDIEQIKLLENPSLPEGNFLGAVMQLQGKFIPGELIFVDIHKDEEFALSTFKKAVGRGYDEAFKTFKATEVFSRIEIESNQK